MEPARRRELKRFGAPVAFLAAATVAVLLIKAGLGSDSNRPVTTSAVTSSSRTSTTESGTTTGATTTRVARYYTIESGDTLGSVAVKEHTSVEELVRLNPGIDPTALRVGQRIRVG